VIHEYIHARLVRKAIESDGRGSYVRPHGRARLAGPLARIKSG
jgi:hypothetical protein